MFSRNLLLTSVVGVATFLGACSETPKAADVKTPISTSLDQAGLKDVTVSQDRDKGVVTLGGKVMSDQEKGQAESIAKSIAGSQVIANQIAVRPPGDDVAPKVDSDLDKGIKNNLDAALREKGFKDDVSYDVKNQVVTLEGSVTSEAKRSAVAQVASHVPYVLQVVNEVQVKNQKATSSN